MGRKILNFIPLVDVLMITMFWFIMVAAEDTSNLQLVWDQERATIVSEAQKNENELLSKLSLSTDQILALMDENEKLNAENESIREMLSNASSSYEIILNSRNEETRTLKISKGESILKSIVVENNTRSIAGDELKIALRDILRQLNNDNTMNVVFLFDGRDSLYLDIDMVKMTLIELSAEYPAFLYRVRDLAE